MKFYLYIYLYNKFFLKYKIKLAIPCNYKTIVMKILIMDISILLMKFFLFINQRQVKPIRKCKIVYMYKHEPGPKVTWPKRKERQQKQINKKTKKS